MMQENLSIIQYIKKKYNIIYIEEIISLFYLSLLCSIIIYLSMKFEVIQMTIIIFVILFFSTYLINQFYKKKYSDQLEIVNGKMKDISELLQTIFNKNNS
jgi:hypothetical protein